MKFNITCKVGVYSNPIKITFNNKSKILTYKNSKITFNFDVDTEYELTIEQIHEDKESVPTKGLFCDQCIVMHWSFFILLILPLMLGHCYPVHHHYLYHMLS